MEIQIFWPLTTYSSVVGSQTAVVRRLARSLPASGSQKPWHQCSSASRMEGSHRAFCSSVPHAMIMGPICQSPLVLNMPGVRYSAITSE